MQSLSLHSAAATRARVQPALPSRRRLPPLAAAASSQPAGAPDRQQQQDGLPLLALKAVMIASAANAVLACLPNTVPAASAAAGWQRRRHQDSAVRERYDETPQQAAARRAYQRQQQAAAKAAQRQAAEQQAAGGPARQGVQQMVHQAQQAVEGLFGQKEAYRVEMSSRHVPYGGGRPPSASPYGWIAVALAGGVALLLLLGRNLRWPGGGRRGQGGRWVRDRSMGGKLVFIPDVELEPGSKAPRPLWEDLDPEDGPAAAAGSSGGVGGSRDGDAWATTVQQPGRGAPGTEKDLPSWWDSPNVLVYAPFSRKEELQRKARVALRQLEDAKLLQGMDYPVSGLVALRTLCQEAGGYQVKPRTDSGRDAMLRAGVRAALSCAQDGQNALLGGDKPAKFVCGLAHDLGVPDARAVTIVHAEVAALCRAALIDAEAGFRAKSQGDILLALSRMATALQAFPLPPGSAEAEMVAAGVVKQTSLEFRKAVFLEFGSVVDAQLAGLIAEMLGFNPELVIPELQRLLSQDAAEAAAVAAEAAMRQPGSA